MKQKGFSLIELLVVVAIIGILAAVGVVAYNGYTKAAKVNIVKSQISQVEKFVSAKMGYCMANGGGSMDLYVSEGSGWPLMNPGDCDKSTMDQKSGGMVNHIDDKIQMRNIYERKPVKNVHGAARRNPIQGNIMLFWETDSNGKNYYVIYGNIGDHIDKSERFIEKRVYDWKDQ